MDIIDAKPTCGCMSRFFAHPDAACAHPLGHNGRHRAKSGGDWDNDMAVWPASRVDTLTSQRDVARSERDIATGRMEMALEEVDDLRASLVTTKQLVEEWRFTATSRERAVAATLAALTDARQVAAEWAAKAREYAAMLEHPFNAGPTSADATPCPHVKAKQFGPATFVVRRCKLTDGHDGQCEPA
jgi:hypothetical protein